METIYQLIEPFGKFLMLLSRNGISTRDFKYIEPYREYLRMCEDQRFSYHGRIGMLSEKYGISEGTLRRKFALFSRKLTF